MTISRWALPGSRWASRWCIGTPRRSVSADLELLGQVRDMCLHGRFYLSLLAVVDMCTARERARRGDRDGAIPLLREVVDDLFHAGQLRTCIGATAFLVETLLERGAGDDVAEAEAAIDRLAAAPADDGSGYS